MAMKPTPTVMTPSMMNSQRCAPSVWVIRTGPGRDPYPSSEAMRAAQVFEHAIANKAAKHVGQGSARVEPGHASRQFGARVPGRHEEDGAGKEWRLHEACSSTSKLVTYWYYIGKPWSAINAPSKKRITTSCGKVCAAALQLDTAPHRTTAEPRYSDGRTLVSTMLDGSCISR